MRYYEIIQETIHIPIDLYEGEIGEIVRMKQDHGKFVQLGDTERYSGKVYYFKRGPKTFYSVDASVYNASRASKHR